MYEVLFNIYASLQHMLCKFILISSHDDKNCIKGRGHH